MSSDDDIATPGPDDGVLWDVLDEHFDELGFAVLRLGRAHAHPLTTLAELPRVAEARLRAHLDGLVLAMPAVGAELAKRLSERVDAERPASMTALALALTASDALEAVELLLEHEDAGLRLAAVRGAVLASSARLDGVARQRRASTPGGSVGWLEYAGLRDLSSPLDPAQLAGVLRSSEREVVEAGLRCLRQPIPSLVPTLERLAERPEPIGGERALRVALAWETPRAFLICEERALDESTVSPTALTAYAMLGGPEEHARLLRSAEAKGRRQPVLRALGFSGSAGVVPELLERLTAPVPADAKVAAQAIAAIAGLDLRRAEFAATGMLSPPGLEPSEVPEASEEPKEELRPVPEDLLEQPNPTAIREWWKAMAPSMTDTPSRRLILGQPWTPLALLQALERAPLGLRGGWALAAHLWSRGQFWLDLEALSDVQLAQCARVRETAAGWAHTGFRRHQG